MYIREDADKLRRRRVITGVWTAVMLATMLVCLWRIDTVCRQQVDTLDQIMEMRMEVSAMAVPVSQITSAPAVNLTAEDYELICRVVAAEARGEGYEGQLAVAQCIRDRAQLWGMTAADVVQQPGQFAAPYQGEVSEEIMGAVNDCLVLGASAFDQPVTHFAEVGITPYWAADKEVVGTVGNHKFYR